MRGNKPYYRRYIEELIDQDPMEITLIRAETQDDGYGGKQVKRIQLEPQKFRLYNLSNKVPVLDTSGKLIDFRPANVEKFLAQWDADIEKGDRFKMRDRTYQVIFVKRLQGISTEAELRVDMDGSESYF